MLVKCCVGTVTSIDAIKGGHGQQEGDESGLKIDSQQGGTTFRFRSLDLVNSFDHFGVCDSKTAPMEKVQQQKVLKI
jgi:hypothetical protein